ncbi:MAG: hypothetical protein KDD66_14720 [Bdellovibrionales bacterium]|nr:hypothetical protein [Bdellovibrionales bacterium]
MSKLVRQQSVETAADELKKMDFRTEGTWSCVYIDLPPRTTQEDRKKSDCSRALLLPVLLTLFLQVVYVSV